MATTRNNRTAWAAKVDRIKVEGAHPEALNINIEGRQLVSPLQGFGQLWQKTFRVRLPGVSLTPEALMQIWKDEFAHFQPPENHFFTSLSGIQPGAVLFIEAKVPPLPGLPSLLPVSTGVVVLYADETSFTVMNPEGHPLSGWNTFSITADPDGCLVAQVQEQSRPSDPLYEFFNRYLGSSDQQDKIWQHVLTQVAARFGVTESPVQQQVVLIDPHVQWSQVGMIWKNAAIRTVFYALGWPLRRLQRRQGRVRHD